MGSQAQIVTKEEVTILLNELQAHVARVQKYLEVGGVLTSEQALNVLTVHRELLEVRNQSIRRALENKVPYSTIAGQWKMSIARIGQLRQQS